ncbi:hypothetical protein YB2330_006022 [Saitoella coloradoensis]
MSRGGFRGRGRGGARGFQGWSNGMWERDVSAMELFPKTHVPQQTDPTENERLAAKFATDLAVQIKEESAFYITIKATEKQQQEALLTSTTDEDGIERYSDRYKVHLQNRPERQVLTSLPQPQILDPTYFPAELHSAFTGAGGARKKVKKLDMETFLDQTLAPMMRSTNDDGDGEDEVEEEADDMEDDFGDDDDNDYGENYFDNGEDYGDGLEDDGGEDFF